MPKQPFVVNRKSRSDRRSRKPFRDRPHIVFATFPHSGYAENFCAARWNFLMCYLKWRYTPLCLQVRVFCGATQVKTLFFGLAIAAVILSTSTARAADRAALAHLEHRQRPGDESALPRPHGQQHEALGNVRPLDDVDRPVAEGTSDCSSFARIAAIGEDVAQPREGASDRAQKRGAPSRSWISAAWTTAPTSSPLVSVRMCRLRPLIFLPARSRADHPPRWL